MEPWPLARFGAAAQLLGRAPEEWLPLTAGLGPELLVGVQVVLGSDLESIGLVTVLDAGDPDAIERAARAAQQVSGDDARSFVKACIRPPGQVVVTALQGPAGAAYSIEHRTPSDVDATLAAHGLSDLVARATRTRLGPLAPRVDHAIDHWAAGTRRIRLGADTTDRDVVAALLDRGQVARGQQAYFADTVAVWTKWNPTMTVRIAVDANGILDEVGVGFRNIPGEHLVRVWRTFHSRTDLAQRIGAVVGAMGVETADRLELRMRRTSEPDVEATFVPATTPFAPVARR